MLLRSSSAASSVDEVTSFNRSVGAPAFPMPSTYEDISVHQEGLGNQWFANPHAHDDPSHIYEAVTNHSESTQSLPVYGYVPTVVSQCAVQQCFVRDGSC